MLITMHDVNFGECILYEENDRKLFVDCGAKFGNKGQDAYNSIKTKIGSNIDLLITHFDEDHYNCILKYEGEKRAEEYKNSCNPKIYTIYSGNYQIAFV